MLLNCNKSLRETLQYPSHVITFDDLRKDYVEKFHYQRRPFIIKIVSFAVTIILFLLKKYNGSGRMIKATLIST